MSERSYDGPKAIETEYNGYKFRSRLEARWAILLDAIGLRYQYEKEGYEVDGRWYLPDFFVIYDVSGHDDWGFWLEVKPTELTGEEIKLLDGLARLTGHHAFAVCGNPWPKEHAVYCFQNYRHKIPDNVPSLVGQLVEVSDDAAGIVDEALRYIGYQIPERYCVMVFSDDNFEIQSFLGHSGCYHNKPKGTLMEAFKVARMARFEHGQTPNKVRLPELPSSFGCLLKPKE